MFHFRARNVTVTIEVYLRESFRAGFEFRFVFWLKLKLRFWRGWWLCRLRSWSYWSKVKNRKYAGFPTRCIALEILPKSDSSCLFPLAVSTGTRTSQSRVCKKRRLMHSIRKSKLLGRLLWVNPFSQRKLQSRFPFPVTLQRVLTAASVAKNNFPPCSLFCRLTLGYEWVTSYAFARTFCPDKGSPSISTGYSFSPSGYKAFQTIILFKIRISCYNSYQIILNKSRILYTSLLSFLICRQAYKWLHCIWKAAYSHPEPKPGNLHDL